MITMRVMGELQGSAGVVPTVSLVEHDGGAGPRGEGAGCPARPTVHPGAVKRSSCASAVLVLMAVLLVGCSAVDPRPATDDPVSSAAAPTTADRLSLLVIGDSYAVGVGA